MLSRADCLQMEMKGKRGKAHFKWTTWTSPAAPAAAFALGDAREVFFSFARFMLEGREPFLFTYSLHFNQVSPFRNLKQKWLMGRVGWSKCRSR